MALPLLMRYLRIRVRLKLEITQVTISANIYLPLADATDSRGNRGCSARFDFNSDFRVEKFYGERI